MNFQIRDLAKIGDAGLELYLLELYNFTIEAFKVPSVSFKFHAGILNQVWQRILQESNALKVTCQNKVEEMIDSIIKIYLEENLRQEGVVSAQGTGSILDNDKDGEDEDENFQKREKTQRAENLDYITRLMRAKTEVSMSLILNFYNLLI